MHTIKHYDHTHSTVSEVRSCTLVTPKTYRTYTEDGQRVTKPQSLRNTEKARTATPSQPSSPQGVDLRTYKQEPGKQVRAIRYALRDGSGEVKFYRVKPGRKEGFFFVDAQASDDLYPIRNAKTKQIILDTIAADPEAALALYGQEIGACGRCGRTLTSEYRKLGIGPKCIDM